MPPVAAKARKGAIFGASIAVGVVSALQNVVNGRAGQQLGRLPVLGSGVSFFSGLVCLTFLVCIEIAARAVFDHRRNAVERAGPLSSELSVEVDTTFVGQFDAVGSDAAGASSLPIPTATPGSEDGITTASDSSDAPGTPQIFASSDTPEKLLLRQRLVCWSPRPRMYMLFPGVIGAIVVTTSVAVTPFIGFALYSVAVVAGQLAVSAVIDARGIPLAGVETQRVPFSKRRAAALLVVFVGCLVAVCERLFDPDAGGGRAANGTDALLVAACVLASAGSAGLLPVQAVLNRASSTRLPSRLQAVWWSFAVGTTLLAAVAAVQVGAVASADVVARLPADFAAAEWWMFAGGPLGVFFVGSVMVLVAVQGASASFVAFITGQLLFSAAADASGLLGVTLRPVTAVQGVGLALAALGAVLVHAVGGAAQKAAVQVAPPAQGTSGSGQAASADQG